MSLSLQKTQVPRDFSQ